VSAQSSIPPSVARLAVDIAWRAQTPSFGD